MRRLWTLTVIVSIGLMTSVLMQSRKSKLTLPTPAKDDKITSAVGVDELNADDLYSIYGPDAIKISDYDKPTSSDVETMLVKNNTDKKTWGIELKITYKDIEGNQIHERREIVGEGIEPGKRMMVTLRSWDKQKSYHYYKSRKAKRASTPYNVEIKVANVFYYLITTEDEQ